MPSFPVHVSLLFACIIVFLNEINGDGVGVVAWIDIGCTIRAYTCRIRPKIRPFVSRLSWSLKVIEGVMDRCRTSDFP